MIEWSRLAWRRFYTNKMPVTAVHLLNTDVLPTFEAQGIPITTVLSTMVASSAAAPTAIPLLDVQREPGRNGGVQRHHGRALYVLIALGDRREGVDKLCWAMSALQVYCDK